MKADNSVPRPVRHIWRVEGSCSLESSSKTWLPDRESAGRQPRPTSAVVPISSLFPADSPRREGIDSEHVRALADTDAALPPILVHRGTMRVIDGMHRLRAAQLRGNDTIEVQLFDGSQDDAFVRAVEANVAHGLPLSLADRKAAAGRILAVHPDWSDRIVATIAGLADTTVGAIRRRPTSGLQQSDTRVGADGRTRPLNSAAGRLKARDVIIARPEATLREIAKTAGISPETARDVRERIRRGDDPVPAKASVTQPGSVPSHPKPPGRPDRHARSMDLEVALHKLRRDPSLRFSETGRYLLQWLGVFQVDSDDSRDIIRTIPPHCAAIVAELARGCAEKWKQIADELDKNP
ncbi:ParB/RepB/Spo0J family partition protein [Nocardia sp. NPDC051052]|uniref:ParB/RepB/Spo0J family partition protein n=1 Tax=Nocardia sp. NPDC051052 TaxID=3364322 RepID=UPI0037B2C3C0